MCSLATAVRVVYTVGCFVLDGARVRHFVYPDIGKALPRCARWSPRATSPTGSCCLPPREQRVQGRKRPAHFPSDLLQPASQPTASSPAARHQYTLMIGISYEPLDTDIRQINKMFVPVQWYLGGRGALRC